MTDKNRRQLIKLMGATSVAIPVSAVIGSLPSHAATLVDESSPEAKNWDYVAMSTDNTKTCNKCALYQADSESASGPCPLFPSKEVSAKGWCKAWTAKPS